VGIVQIAKNRLHKDDLFEINKKKKLIKTETIAMYMSEMISKTKSRLKIQI